MEHKLNLTELFVVVFNLGQFIQWIKMLPVSTVDFAEKPLLLSPGSNTNSTESFLYCHQKPEARILSHHPKDDVDKDKVDRHIGICNIACRVPEIPLQL